MFDPRLLSVARGDEPADLLLTGGRVVNVFTCEVEAANVAVCLGEGGGRVAGIGDYQEGKERVELGGSFVGPGFIDAHMHVESTMMPPSEFVRLAAPHGTTGVVLDPHEIANVIGVRGIRYVMEDSEGLPLHAMFALSSCVPSSHLETSGARLEAEDLGPLFEDPRVVALAEVMNFPGVIGGDTALGRKIGLGLRRHVVDGHSPGLTGRGLRAYVAAGISSDHECTTAAEALEKLRLGMMVYFREGSAARNLEALLPVVSPVNRARFCFCTDDRHPEDLKNEGHIDHVVRKAIRLGMDPVMAIAIGSLHAADHYRRGDLGAVAPGRWADLVVFDDLREPRPRLVYCRGALVAKDGEYLVERRERRAAPEGGGVVLPEGLSERSFRSPVTRGGARIRIIEMDPHQIVTGAGEAAGRIVDGGYAADPSRDILKLAVIERHGVKGRVGVGFVRGFGFKAGALASTVGHDSHNLTVVGSDDGDMLLAARTLAGCGGGQCVVRGGRVLAVLPLPICGLMSDRPAEQLIEMQRALHAASREIGCPHDDPFMPLSFLPLPVIPALKLTDLGLVDVGRFEVVGVEI